MTCINTIRQRVEGAGNLAALLDAAYDAFEQLISLTQEHAEPADGWFAALVFAGSEAAEGRDAVAPAPSLPARQLAGPRPEQAGVACQSIAAVAGGMADMAGILAARLIQAAMSAPEPGDRTACWRGARCAQEIHVLLAGNGP
jgi:hypothetical protein